MEGHGKFAFNLVTKLSVELGYVFLSLRLQTESMSSALLSVLLMGRFKIIVDKYGNYVRKFIWQLCG
jgi:hypothetical protein